MTAGATKARRKSLATEEELRKGEAQRRAWLSRNQQ
jgi:hypothetical protein